MYQLENFKILQFRKLRHLELNGLGRINLLVGPNNSGKTSVLEAISCYCNPQNGYNWLETALGRSGRDSNVSRIKALKWLFPQKSESTPPGSFEADAITLQSFGDYSVSECYAKFEEYKAIEPSIRRADTIVGELSGTEGEWERLGASLLLRVELGHDHPQSRAFSGRGPTMTKDMIIWDDKPVIRRKTENGISLPVAYISAAQIQSDAIAAEGFSVFRKLGLYDEAMEILHQLDPGVREVLVLSDKGNSGQLYVQHERTGLTPLNAMGDGFRRSLQIAMTIPTVKKGILLIDEIESALHVTALTQVFELLVKNCKAHDVQLFATTHSLEALDSILNVSLKIQDPDLVLYRLANTPNGTAVVRLDEKTLATVRNDLGQEVR